jgi:hypothetical protein
MLLLLSTLSALIGLVSAGKGNARNPSPNGGLNKDLFNSGKDWVTLDNGVEFQPGQEMDPRIEHVRKLWSAGDHQDPYDVVFLDGGETYYDDYSQAWRALGFYIDCDAKESDAYRRRRARSLEEEEYTPTGCRRYMLWAAVSRLDFEGNKSSARYTCCCLSSFSVCVSITSLSLLLLYCPVVH